MGESDKLDIDIFDQIDEALEERGGSDRRKQDAGVSTAGEDRRKGSRRKEQPDHQ